MRSEPGTSKTKTRAVRLTGSVGALAYEVQSVWLAKTIDGALDGTQRLGPRARDTDKGLRRRVRFEYVTY